MSANMIETAKMRRLLLIEKKRFKEDLRQMRHRRMSRPPTPMKETVQAKPPAA